MQLVDLVDDTNVGRLRPDFDRTGTSPDWPSVDEPLASIWRQNLLPISCRNYPSCSKPYLANFIGTRKSQGYCSVVGHARACTFPSKLRLRMGRSGPHLIHSSLGPPESSTQTASRSVQPFFRAHYCNRQTDKPTDKQTTLLGRSVTIGRTYLRSTAMRPNNNFSVSKCIKIDFCNMSFRSIYRTKRAYKMGRFAKRWEKEGRRRGIDDEREAPGTSDVN